MDARRALLLPGDLLRLAATFLLLHKLRKTGGSRGVSLQTQALLALVHACRFADLVPSVLSGAWHDYQPSIYHVVMKVLYLSTSAAAALAVWHLQQARQQQQQGQSSARQQAAVDDGIEAGLPPEEQAAPAADAAGPAGAEAGGEQGQEEREVLRPAALIIPCALLTPLCTQAHIPLELLWTFSVLLEVVAALPQLLLMERCPCDGLMVCYVAMLGAYRAFSLASWTWRLLVEPIFDPDPLRGPLSALASPSLVLQWACGLLQFCLFADFFVARFGLRKPLRATLAFCLLAAARLAGALLRVPGASPDETYGGLEPLHLLLYGSGQLGWEYGAAAALRSFLYPALHAVALAPFAAALGQPGKVVTLFILRCMLGLASAATGAWLYSAVAGRYRPAVAHCLLLFLCLSPGLFAASTAMLPSGFTMCCLTAAAAAFLESRPKAAIAAAAIGLVWGWPSATPVFLPYLAWALWRGPAARMLRWLLLCLLATLGPQLLADRMFYGRWVVTQLNWAAQYLWASAGSGNTPETGPEGLSFYRRSAGSDFGLLLSLALALPLLAQVPDAAGTLQARGPSLGLPVCGPGASSSSSSSKGGADGDGSGCSEEAELGSKQAEGDRRSRRDLLLCVLPLYAWFLLLTLAPHKQAQFLYPVYPLMCLAAAAACVLLYALSKRALLRGAFLPPRAVEFALRSAAALSLVALCVLALSGWIPRRTELQGPAWALARLPHEGSVGPPIHVCVGAEWRSFPSSFYLRGPWYRLQFFGPALSPRPDPTAPTRLPRPYSRQQGALLAWPSSQRFALNRVWHSSTEQCGYAFTLVAPEQGPPPPEGSDAAVLEGDSWEQVSSWLPTYYPTSPDPGSQGSLPWFTPYWLPSQAAGSAYWANSTTLGAWALLRHSDSNATTTTNSSVAEQRQAGTTATLAELRRRVSGMERWRSAELAQLASGLPWQPQRSWQWAGLWNPSLTSDMPPAQPAQPNILPVFIGMQLLFFLTVLHFFYSAVKDA
ncbi:hypothetical protein ABPG75_006266 [Micractinium tetrahymenae]